MRYKGYEAIVEFDPEDSTYYSRVPTPGYQILLCGDTVAELEQSFHQTIDRLPDINKAIDEYPEDC